MQYQVIISTMVPLWYHHISIYRLSRYAFKDFRRTTEPRSLELLPLQGGRLGEPR